MTLFELPEILKSARRVVDEEWNKLSPERKQRIRDNILKKVERRMKAEKKEDEKEAADGK